MVDEVLNWLMEGDPTIRYQTAKDLLEDTKEDIDSHHMFIDVEGWGKELLEKQDEDGKWCGSYVDPEFKSTLWIVTELRRMGLPRDNYKAKQAAELLLDVGLQKDGGLNFVSEDIKESEVCHSALVLSALSFFRVINRRRDAIFEFLIESQMEDGGWNCKWKQGATHSSFHTTLVVLESLREYAKVKKGERSYINKLQAKAHEFLLIHRLYISHRNDNVVDEEMLLFAHPTFWKYDILTALDYFQSINHPYDKRFEPAIQSIKRRRERGRWSLEKKYEGEFWIQMEELNKPSRWITLKVIRVMNWWDNVSKYKF